MSRSKKSKRHSNRLDRPTERRGPSRRRRHLFILISLLFPILVLAGFEGVLRLFGFGGFPTTIREIASTDQGTLCITDTPGPASYFFANKTRAGSNDQYAFFSPKQKGTLRIVTAGGSAMKGFPQPMAFASSAFLQAMLSDVWPQRTVEVINLGTTAVASFPVLGMLTEAVDYQPDLVVVYCGHNEYYGAYGVTSLHTGGQSPTAIRLHHWSRSLGLVQFLERFQSGSKSTDNKTLMEAVIGKSFIGPADPVRATATRNLETHIGEMIDLCHGHNIPVIVCTLAGNERDLAPLGTDDLSHFSEADRQILASQLATGAQASQSNPDAAIAALKSALAVDPDHARAHYLLGRSLFAQKQFKQASAEFQKAIDLDPMPWRAPGPSNDAIRRAAKTHRAVLCDARQMFRDASPGGCIGWELLDDHVHPSLRGQTLLARAIVKTLTTLDGPLNVSRAAYQALPSWRVFAQRLGDNKYDRYGVAHTLRVLCHIPFYLETNPGAYRRFHKQAVDFESSVSPEIRKVAIEWQKPSTHQGAKRPMSGMAGRVMVREKNYSEGERLFRTARHCVAQYSDWNLEYSYFLLACRRKRLGSLNTEDREIAAAAIERGRLLIHFSTNPSGETRRYVGRMLQLRGEYAESIAYLKKARESLYEMDRVATDAALVEAYLQTGDLSNAHELASNGVLMSGKYAPYYRQLLSAISLRQQGGNLHPKPNP